MKYADVSVLKFYVQGQVFKDQGTLEVLRH